MQQQREKRFSFSWPSQVKRLFLAAVFFLSFFQAVEAQVEVSVPFNDGFIGLVGSNTNQATNIQRFSTLGIVKAQFIQTTNSGRFEIQGNDISGVLRLQLTNGRKVDIAGALNWRVNSGATNQLFGFIAEDNIALNLSAYGGVNYSISGGRTTGKSSFGFKLNNVTYTLPATGQSVSGNAATGVTALGDLDDYLSVQPRVIAPAPVNFLLNTPNQDPGNFVVANFGTNDVILASVGLVNPPVGTTFSFGTTTGLTRSTGYSSWTGLTRISFTGTQANVNAALASLSVDTGTSSGDIKLSVSATLNESGVFYNPVNGHYYKPVTGTFTYANAKSGAAGQTYKGATGYLVAITSAVEQDFVTLNTTQNNIWIALTDEIEEGKWKIDAGPELGTLIKTLNSGGEVSGQYNNWCGGEPNNASNEDYAVTKWNGGNCWNDLAGTNTSSIGGYLIEFGNWTDPDDNAFLDFYSASTTYVANCPSNQAPVAPTAVSAGTNAGAGSVQLVVSVASGMTVDWYASATGGTVLSGGQGVTTFNTPIITGTTVFYAQARNASTGCLSATRTAVTATIVPCPTTLPNVRFKLSPPDVTTSAIQGQSGSRTENFNGFSLGNLGATGTFAVGAFTRSNTGSVTVTASDVWGGSGSQYLQAANSGEVSITLTDPSRYVGFWWAAGNSNNNVTIFGSCGGNEIQLGTFTAQTVINLLAGSTITAVNGTAYNTSLYKRANAANEPFAYINLELDDPNIYFTRIVFGGSGFEFDNITTAIGYGAASSTTPGAPTITSITRGTGTATINFTAPTSNGGQAITNYQYSIDGGTNWLTLSPADITTPLIISGLNDATAYPIRIRAVNSIGGGAQSNSVNATVCTPPQVAAISNQVVCAGAATTGITFSPPNTAGYQWMTLNSIASGTATGTGQNGITVSITQSGGGLGTESGMYDATRFPAIYSVPTSGNQIRNTKAGVFTATFSQPVTNPLVAFASVGNPNLPVPVIVSAPFTPIWTNTANNFTTTYDLPNRTFTGREGYNIIRVDGTVSSVSFNYTVEEFYATMAFGFEDQNTTYTWTNDTPSIGLAASGTGNILPFNAINTGSTPVTATITVTPSTATCAGTPRTFTITVNPSPTLSYPNSSYALAAGQAITPITPTTNGTSFAISPALPTGLSFNTSTGVISGTPTANSTSRTYTVTGTTSLGCAETTTFTLEVFSVVAPSALSYSPATQTVRQGTAISAMTPTISGGAPTYTISPSLPAGLSINATTGVISGTLTAAQTGTVTYTITATNTAGSTTATISLVFNTAPTAIALAPAAVAENTASGTTVGTLSATDADTGDTFTYALVSGTGSTDNASFTIDGTSLKTAAVFDFETKASYSVRVRVTDAGGLTFEQALTITVTDVNEDRDGDGVKDDEERADGTDPLDACSFKLASQNATPSDAWKAADCDNDGLTNQREKDLGTDPLKADTDGDGVPDGVEVTDGTDPLDASKYKDTDGDLVPDFVETADGTATGDSLKYKDSDKDGVPDYIELRDGTNPNSATSFKDTDGGGVPDYVEVTLFPNMGLAPANPNVRGDDTRDTDGDGVPDYQEFLEGTDPKDPSSFLDSDGDGVPNHVERIDGTDPNNSKEFKSSNGDGVADYIRDRSVQVTVPQEVVLAWGTKNPVSFLPKEVEVGIFSGLKTKFQVVWNKTETLNILKRGTYELTGTLVLPKGYYNPYKVNGQIRVIVLPKPAPRDVTIDNSTFVGSTSVFFIGVGAFAVNDPVDNIHVVSLLGDGYDNKFFSITDNVLYWNSGERAPGKVTFSIVVRVTDRDGNTLDKFFTINRTRLAFDNLTIYNTFTPNSDRFNDTWGVPEIRFYEGVRISVYERGGARLFYTENPDIRWDGTYEGKEMPVGSYYWVIQIDETGATRRGIVNLLRK